MHSNANKEIGIHYCSDSVLNVGTTHSKMLGLGCVVTVYPLQCFLVNLSHLAVCRRLRSSIAVGEADTLAATASHRRK